MALSIFLTKEINRLKLSNNYINQIIKPLMEKLMKKILCLLVAIIGITSFASEVDSKPLSKEENNGCPGQISSSRKVIDQRFMVAVGYSFIETGSTLKTYQQPIFQMSYQILDNVWAEFNFGTSTIEDYPGPGLGTKLESYIGKLKYSFASPLDSVFQPYLGYQKIEPYSPAAGKGDASQDLLDEELFLVNSLKKGEIIFGVSLIKIFSSTWLTKLDLGTDVIAVNFGVPL